MPKNVKLEDRVERILRILKLPDGMGKDYVRQEITYAMKEEAANEWNEGFEHGKEYAKNKIWELAGIAREKQMRKVEISQVADILSMFV